MAQTALEIVVEGATGLKTKHLIQGLQVYPVVRIVDSDGNSYYDSENKKAVDVNGGSNPKWRVLFECNNIDIVDAQQKQLDLIVRLESHRVLPCCPDKYVGEVRVPIEELRNDFGDAVEKKSTIRPVLKKGKEHGSLTFTYKFMRTLNHPPATLPQPAALPQPANGNSVAQIPPRSNDSHPLVKAAVEGAANGFVRTVGSVAKEFIFR